MSQCSMLFLDLKKGQESFLTWIVYFINGQGTLRSKSVQWGTKARVINRGNHILNLDVLKRLIFYRDGNKIVEHLTFTANLLPKIEDSGKISIFQMSQYCKRNLDLKTRPVLRLL